MRHARGNKAPWMAGLLIGGLLILLYGIHVWLTHRDQFQHAQLDRQLIAAVQRNDAHTVLRLLQQGARANAQSGQEKALHLAALKNEPDMVRLLVDSGASIDAQDTAGNTALMIAADRGEEAVVKVLLDRDAYLNAQNKNGLSALMLCLQHTSVRHEACAKQLLAKDVEVDMTDKHGRTALSIALANRHMDLIPLLKQAGAKR